MTKSEVILYDATLLVDAYVTQLYRTGLYRVCAELLKQLLKHSDYELWLVDVQGRERLLRNAVTNTIFKDLHVIQTDSNVYKCLAYGALNKADELRCKEQEHDGLRRYLYRFRKGLYVRWGRLVQRVVKPVDIQLPQGRLHYISTYYPIPQWVHEKGVNATLIVHDLIPLMHPEWFPSKQNKQTIQEIIDSVSRNDKVVCVSESTRQDFLRYRTDFSIEHTSVAYLAAAEVFKPSDMSNKLRERYDIKPNKYILSVGTLEPRKNVRTVVQAYEKLLKDGNCDVKLVLSGAKGWKTGELLEKIERLNKQYGDMIVLSGYVTDEELAELYSNCIVFVYMSLYEGFGLPPLEAMQCGAPVITSNVSSLPEVVGKAGLLIDPCDLEGLVIAMKKMLTQDICQVKSLHRASDFSWKKFANIIIESIV